MSVTETKALATLIRNTWKQLALADQTDAEALAELLKETLGNLEDLEAMSGE